MPLVSFSSKGLVSAAALLETQLNFIRTCPYETEDKIMLLIQKLEEKKQYLIKLIHPSENYHLAQSNLQASLRLVAFPE